MEDLSFYEMLTTNGGSQGTEDSVKGLGYYLGWILAYMPNTPPNMGRL